MTALKLTSSRGFGALLSSKLRPLSQVQQLSQRRSFAAQGYGDPKGDPVSSDPQSQGPNSEATHSAEHPGPTSPHDRAKQKSRGKNPEDASAQSGGSRSKEAVEKGSSPTAGSIGGKD